MNNTNDRKSIVFIDHEDSIDQIVTKIGNRTSTLKHKDVKDIYRLSVHKIPANTFTNEEMIKFISSVEPKPSLILIDLLYSDDRSSEDAFEHAIKRIEILKEKFIELPIGVFTRYPIDSLKRIHLSTGLASIIIENVNSHVESAEPFSGDKWDSAFDSAIESERKKQRFSMLEPIRFFHTEKVKWSKGYPKNPSPTFRKAGLILVERLVSQLQDKPDLVEVKELSGGYSGAFILLAELFFERSTGLTKGPNLYVIKIDESPLKIKEEFNGYRIIRERLNPKNFLIPIPGFENQFVSLYNDFWAAYAMYYTDEAKNLLDQFDLPADKLIRLIEKLYTVCLKQLYGKIVTKKTSFSDIYHFEVWERANNAINDLKIYINSVEEKYIPVGRLIKKASDFIQNKHLPNVEEEIIPIGEYVHGDLNCRNILYNPNDESFQLIDFSRVKSKDCLALDFVRFESELILFLMNKHDGLDIDISMLKEWVETTELLSEKFVVDNISKWNQEATKIINSIRMVRSCYQVYAKDNGIQPSIYKNYLCARLMLYSNLNQITIPKRLLCLAWIGQLIDKTWV